MRWAYVGEGFLGIAAVVVVIFLIWYGWTSADDKDVWTRIDGGCYFHTKNINHAFSPDRHVREKLCRVAEDR